MISFVYSVPNKFKGVNLPNYPVQIIPYSRSRINEREIIAFPNIEKNIGSVVHATYLCKPFGMKFKEFVNVNMLRTYKELCEKIKFNFLFHGPQNEKEMKNFEMGMSIVRDVFKDFQQKILVEVPSFNSGFRMDVEQYLDKIVKEFDDKFEICIDTAHLFANGCQSKDIIRICEKFSNLISTIHLNGNGNEQFRTDYHLEIFNPKSKLTDIDEMMKFFKSKGWLLIAEVTRAEYGYSDWKAFADKYELKIVEFSEKLIIKHEKVL